MEQHGRILASVQNSVPNGNKQEDRSPIPMVTKKEEPSRRLTCSQQARQRQRREVKVADIFHVPTFSTETVFDDKPEDMDEEYYFPPGVKKSKSLVSCMLGMFCGCYNRTGMWDSFLMKAPIGGSVCVCVGWGEGGPCGVVAKM